MKKYIFGAALAALVMLSACETVEPQEILSDSTASESVSRPSGTSGAVNGGTDLITATIGADTKTYLEYDWVSQVYKTRWSENDKIYLIEDRTDTFVYQPCALVDGAGTSSGTFSANLEADTYVAVYCYNAFWNAGNIFVQLPETQFHYSYVAQNMENKDFMNAAYPMVARSSSNSFQFENLCSVLKVCMKGNGERLEKIRVRSNGGDDMLSGEGLLDFSGAEPTMIMETEGGYNYVDYNVYMTLGPEPLDCYIVLPSQVYDLGFTLEFYTSDGIMDVTTGTGVELERSRLHEIPEIEYVNEYPYSWALVGEYDWNEDGLADWDSDIAMTKEGQWWVLRDQYLDAKHGFKLRRDRNWGVNFGGHETSVANVNEATVLAYDGYDLWVPESGYYDIYLDAVNEFLYVMEKALTPDDIGTIGAVECKSYSDIASQPDHTTVNVTGYVMMTYGYGFIMSVGTDNEYILVYTRTEDVNGKRPVVGTYVEIYASKTTYRGLPELENVARFEVLNGNPVELDLTPVDLSSSDFENFHSDGYDYVRFRGHLSQSGSYYNVNVEGATRIGSISRPLMDMDDYIDKDVVVEGFFCGLNVDKNGNEYLNVIATRLDTVVSFSGSI